SLEVLLVNVFFLAALCLYHAAIRRFHGLSIYSHVYILLVIGVIPFVYFTEFVPDTGVRRFIATTLWVAVMSATTLTLARMRRTVEFHSVSNMTMIVVYAIAL